MAKKKGSVHVVSNSEISVIHWIVLSFVILFLSIAPFYKALFNGGILTFERPIYLAFLWTALVFIVIVFYMLKKWRLQDERDIFSLLIWLIPLSYFISMFHAASYHASMISLYIHIIYAVFFIIGLYFSRNKLGLDIVIHAIVVSGYLVVIYGLMNWFGNASYQDAVFGSTRLSNVFQYPNTYASYLIGLLFSSLILISTSKRWYMILSHGAMLVPIVLSLLLTSSRGGMLVLPVVLVLYLLFLPLAKQFIQIIYIMISVVISMLLMEYFTNIRIQLNTEYIRSLSYKGWAVLISLSLFTMAVIYIFHKYIAPKVEYKLQTKKKSTNYIIPISIIVFGLVGIFIVFGNTLITDLLPDPIKQRIANVNKEDVRSTFNSDSMKLIQDYPIFGAGGGAWKSLVSKYQSYPYLSSQAHNFYLQYITEVGLFGFVILIGLLICIFGRFIRIFSKQQISDKYLVFAVIAFTILIHSIVDFDLSFVYLGALLFLCLGAMSSLDGTKVIALKERTQRWSRLFPISLCILAIVMIVSSSRLVMGNSSYIDAIAEVNQSGDYNEIVKKLDNAISKQSNHPDYVLMKIDLLKQAYDQTKDEDYYLKVIEQLNRLKEKEPYNRRVMNEVYTLNLMKGELEQSLSELTSKVSSFPWDVTLYEKVMYLNYQLGYLAKITGNKDNAEHHWKNGLGSYLEIIEKRDFIKTLSERQQYESYSFKISPTIYLLAGQIYFMQEDYEQAETTLALGRSNNLKESINKDIALWYLATKQVQGKEDKSLYDLLSKEDEALPERIEEIVASTK